MQINEPAVLRQRLIDACDTAYHVVDFQTIVEVLQTLESLPVTKEVLETTRLGRTVNEFRRKVDDGNLAKRAKALVKKWRNEVLPEEASPAVTQSPKSTAHFNGNSHLAAAAVALGGGPSPSPAPELGLGASASSPTPSTPCPVKIEPDMEVTITPIVVEPDPVPVVETPAPKKGRGRAKKKKLLTIDDKIADTTLELQAQLAKAEELKHGRVHPSSMSGSVHSVVPPKLSRLIAGEDSHSVSSPDSSASGAASTVLQNSTLSQIQPSPVLSPQDQIIKNEIIEKYLKSQTELKSQMHRQYLDRLARNEFDEEEKMEQEDDETSRSSLLQPANSISSNGSPPAMDVTDAGGASKRADNLSPSVSSTIVEVENGTLASAKGRKKARLKDSNGIKIEDADELEAPIFETEAEILAKLPPIDPEILSEFSNYTFYVDPERPAAGEFKLEPTIYTTSFNSNTNETEQRLSTTSLLTTSSFPVTSNYATNFNNVSNKTPVSVTPNLSRGVKAAVTTRKVIKKVRRQREPRPKSLFDVSDEEDDDEDEFEEIEVEEIVVIEEPSTVTARSTSPVPMEVEIPSVHEPSPEKKPTDSVDSGLVIGSNNSSNLVNDISDTDKSSSEHIHSQNLSVACNDIIVEEKSQEPEPEFMRVVEDSEVDDLLTKHIVGLNGNYDKTGAFREFHQTILVETYRSEDFHILPYTIIDF